MKMRTANQLKAEASRLFEMARDLDGHPDAIKLLYAREAILSALNEQQFVSEQVSGDPVNGINCGHGWIECQLRHYELIRSGRYPHIAIHASHRRQTARDRRKKLLVVE